MAITLKVWSYITVTMYCRYIKGFMLRNEPECDENRGFIHFTRYNYLIRLRDNLPKSVLDKRWPSAPKLVQEVSVLHAQPNRACSSYCDVLSVIEF